MPNLVKNIRPSLLKNSSFNVTSIPKMLMRDEAIIHYALFFKKNNDSSCALFEGRLRNAGIYTTIFSGWKTQLHLFTVTINSIGYIHFK